ncbi:MAG: DMT family transporter [Actinomycetota bacterium]|nr:DMT family transporter [Actinomycetota bacterium]
MGTDVRGLSLALLSAAAFGSSGPFARALLDAGWTPGAAVLVRVAGSALVLVALTLLLRRPQLRAVLRARRTVLVYGVVAVAGVQVCFFSAVQTLSVGVALLLEYLAPVLVVCWLWLHTGRRPSRRTVAGGVLALLGTAGVLDVFSGATIHPAGVLWALGAAVCLSCYFLVLGRDADAGEALDPAALATAGMVVDAVAVSTAAAAGVLPVTFGSATTTLAGRATPTWLPVLTLVLVSTVLAYLAGAAALARLGAAAGSLTGLSEVVFAVVAAWLLLGQWPTGVQLLGGALVLAGVALAQTRRRTSPAAPAPAAVEVAAGPA